MQSFVRRLQADRVLQLMLHGSAVSLATRIAGLAFAFLSHILLARTMGAQSYGAYAIALGWAMLLVLPARLGLDNAALRFGTIYREEGRYGALRGHILLSLFAIAAASALLIVLAIAAKWLGNSLLNHVSWGLLLCAAALIFPLAVLGWMSALLRTAHQIFASQFFEQILRPAILVVSIGLFALLNWRLNTLSAMQLTVVSAAVAAVGIGIATLRAFAPLRKTTADYGEWRKWLSVSWVLLIISFVQEALNQIDILALGFLANATAAAHFTAASRLSSFVLFGLVAIVTVSGPLIGSAYHRGQFVEVAKIARVNARISFAFGVVMALFLILAGRSILGAFGSGFSDSYPVLLILLVGALVNAFTGSVGYYLLLTGRQKVALAIFCLALAVDGSLNFLLIPSYGAVGSAIASSTAAILWNLAMLIYVRRTLGIDASAIGLAPRLATQSAG